MKTAYKAAANKIKANFALLDAARVNLRSELDNISADIWTSDIKKEQLRKAAVDNTRSQLDSIRAEIETAAGEMGEALKAYYNHFDYSDSKLINAINFLNTIGADAPDAATAQIINDFKDQPAALRLIKNTFDKNGLGSASIAAGEEMTRFRNIDNLPQRISDAVYYATNGDFTKSDFSAFISEIDSTSAAIGIEEE